MKWRLEIRFMLKTLGLLLFCRFSARWMHKTNTINMPYQIQGGRASIKKETHYRFYMTNLNAAIKWHHCKSVYKKKMLLWNYWYILLRNKLVDQMTWNFTKPMFDKIFVQPGRWKQATITQYQVQLWCEQLQLLYLIELWDIREIIICLVVFLFCFFNDISHWEPKVVLYNSQCAQ